MQQEITNETLDKINTFTKKELTADEVYTFSVILCDNEIDRDNERFSIGALNTLSKLFIGKTGISDHNPKSSNQTARIYDTEIVTDGTRKTSAGESYTYLKAYAYMVKTSKNEDVIKEIDGGIKKEVSVSCSISKGICSVCSADTKVSACAHRKGRIYNGSKCHIILDNPTDAYEWSFVAVPAQKNAGVTKKSTNKAGSDEITLKLSDYEALVTKAQETDTDCCEMRESLRRSIIKLSFLYCPQMSVSTVSRLAEGMTLSELSALKAELEKTHSQSAQPQTLAEKQSEGNTAFKM